MQNWLRSAVSGLFLERPAQKLTLTDHADRLAAAGEKLRRQFAAARGTDTNRAILRHIIGIERWGQRRLQVALGEPLIMDEYDNYCPDEATEWNALRIEFDDTRQATLVVIEELVETPPDETLTVPHNQYGKLSVYGWLHYLRTHANLEAKRLQ